MMRRLCLGVVLSSLVFGLAASSYADLVVLPQNVRDMSITNLPIGVQGDSPTGWGSGSWQANGSKVTEYYFSPNMLFNKNITIGDIQSISFWTKKGTTHIESAPDWFFTIYTTPFAGSWYGYRIIAEPYFSENLNDPANEWNLWSSDRGNNWLRFFVSGISGKSVYNGAYTDPHLDAFKLRPSARSTGATMADEPIQSFRMSTASGWANGFTGQLDGLTITLTDGTAARVNFEAVPEPATLVGLASLGASGLGAVVLRRRKKA